MLPLSVLGHSQLCELSNLTCSVGDEQTLCERNPAANTLYHPPPLSCLHGPPLPAVGCVCVWGNFFGDSSRLGSQHHVTHSYWLSLQPVCPYTFTNKVGVGREDRGVVSPNNERMTRRSSAGFQRVWDSVRLMFIREDVQQTISCLELWVGFILRWTVTAQKGIHGRDH